jgi:hypothetical protein
MLNGRWAGGTHLSVRNVNKEGGKKVNVKKKMLLGFEPMDLSITAAGSNHMDTDSYLYIADMFFHLSKTN